MIENGIFEADVLSQVIGHQSIPFSGIAHLPSTYNKMDKDVEV